MSFDAAPTDLAGKACLVTGANGGISMATAEHFAACGARVLTTDLGDSFAGDCEATHRGFDLTCDEGLSALCDWIASEISTSPSASSLSASAPSLLSPGGGLSD